MKKVHTFLTFLFVGACIAFSMTGCFIIRNNFYTDPEECYAAAEKKSFDAVIVPGFPHDTAKGWDRIVKGRVYWAVFLYNKGIAKNIIFSGSAVYTPYVESKVMALYAEQLGIPKEHIFVETQAEHSTENLYYSYQLGKAQGFQDMALATDPVQSSFLVSYKRKFKLKDLYFVPILYDTLKAMEKTDPVINCEGAYIKDFVPLTEREGLIKRVRGTGGRKIKKILRTERREARKQRRIAKKNKPKVINGKYVR